MDWVAIGTGMVSSLLAAELYLWLPTLAERLIRYHASRIPPELSDRMLEEWSAVLADTPGNFAKCAFALDLFRATPRITHEFYFPGVPFKASTAFSIRLMDVLLAATCLIGSSPLWGLIALVIKLDDGGTILYRGDRVGKGGKVFRVLKFRSMIFDAETHDDPKVTRAGRLLRATALDELPQLWNILAGHMSFRGPRALRPGETK